MRVALELWQSLVVCCVHGSNADACTVQDQAKTRLHARAEMEAGLAQMDAEVAAARSGHEEAAAQLAAQRAALAECDAGLAELASQRAELEKAATDAAVNKKKLEHKCAGSIPPLATCLLQCVTLPQAISGLLKLLLASGSGRRTKENQPCT